MTKLEYIKLVNKLRKENKNKWVSFTQDVEGLKVGIKFFNKWIQIMEVNDGISIKRYDTPMDCKVTVWNATLDDALKC